MPILCWLLTAYIVVLTARVVLSWFPISPGSPIAPIASLLYDLTEPVLAPMRRIIPPAGMFDLSPIVVFIGLFLLRDLICR